MAIYGLSHMNLRLSQPVLDVVVDFYTNVLGFAIGERPPFTSSGIWLYASGRPIVHLVLVEQNEGPLRHQSAVLDHVAFSSTDYDTMLARLEAAGIQYRKQQVPERPMRQLFFKDPVGIGIELIFDEDQAPHSARA